MSTSRTYDRGPARDRGMTLIEMLMVLAIVAAMGGIVALSYRQVKRAEAKGVASNMAAAIRYLYGEAIVTGKFYRLQIGLRKVEDRKRSDDDASRQTQIEEDTYAAEKSDKRVMISSKKDDRPPDPTPPTGSENVGGFEGLQAWPKPQKPEWKKFTLLQAPRGMKGAAFIRDVYVSGQREPTTEGTAVLRFFPNGQAESAYIHIVSGARPDPDDMDSEAVRSRDVYTLIVHGLSGRVEMKLGDIDPPSRMDGADEGVQ